MHETSHGVRHSWEFALQWLLSVAWLIVTSVTQQPAPVTVGAMLQHSRVHVHRGTVVKCVSKLVVVAVLSVREVCAVRQVAALTQTWTAVMVC